MSDSPSKKSPSEKSRANTFFESTMFRSSSDEPVISRERALSERGEPEPSSVRESIKSIPDRIGRFKIRRLIGEGGFGRVFEAIDGQLNRTVAIKVSHAGLISTLNSSELYLTEARTVASLDHPHIVPVYDVGCDDDDQCFVVSKYINGPNLAQFISRDEVPRHVVLDVVATVAETLHYAHSKGIVHRDVTPGNILIGPENHAYVCDFGLALRNDHGSDVLRYAGTPTYMSPEQARGEGHRVDGRSDIFSLGAVLYFLLVGHPPFEAETSRRLLRQIVECDPVPLTQINSTIPDELERICMKALSRQVSERYATAREFAEDLRCFLAVMRNVESGEKGSFETNTNLTHSLKAGALFKGKLAVQRDVAVARVVPKGLRSFDAHDAAFFLELLPGPRDRTGLPDSLRFWKTRIEERGSTKTFPVGVLFGPSGCGKTSLVKAGLLPRLASHVLTVYVEATPVETEMRLFRALQHRCPGLNPELSLKEAMSEIRQGRTLRPDEKILIVIDQFEQWLHNARHLECAELVEALRQCDGERLQCLVMVRDDFWMATTRLMHALDMRILEGENSATVDLFSARHAEKVLLSFGRAYGIISEETPQGTPDQQAFMRKAVHELSENERIVCVRLSLFAEMMKDKPWSLKSLKAIGGPHGVGRRFLEEKLGDNATSPKVRFYQQAAQRVLKALLPESTHHIKGQQKSYEQLLRVSGCTGRDEDFRRLIRILDVELRLISPTDFDIAGAVSTRETQSHEGHASTGRCYQLTHDYLIPPLREWLTRRQKETRRGRAELLLADRAAHWDRNPEDRNLPRTREWLWIRLFTEKSRWTESQLRMMQSAGRVNRRSMGIAMATCLVLVLVCYATWVQVREETHRQNAKTIIGNLETASSEQVPEVIGALDLLPRQVVLDELEARFEDSSHQHRLRLAYGLAHYDRYEVSTIVEAWADRRTPTAEAENVLLALSSCKDLALPLLRSATVDASRQADLDIKARIALLSIYLGDNSVALDILKCKPLTNSSPPATPELPNLLAHFASQVETLPKFPTILRDPAESQYVRAVALYYLGEYEEANEILQVLAADADADPDVLSLSAVCLAQAGQWEESNRMKERLDAPQYPKHYRVYVTVLSDAYRHRIESAEAAIRELASENLQAPESLYHAARLSSQLSRILDSNDPRGAAKYRALAMDLLREVHEAMGALRFPRADLDPDFLPLHDEPAFRAFIVKLFPPPPVVNPEPRTQFIKTLSDWPGDLLALAAMMADVEDPDLRYGIALGIGGIENPAPNVKSAWEGLLGRWSTEDPDPGTANAAIWALRMWDLPVPSPAESHLSRNPKWWRTSELSMVRIPAGDINTGAGNIIVKKDFWMSDHEITVELYERFVDECSDDLRPLDWEGCRDFGAGNDNRFPAQRVSWQDGILFCNWLSQLHGLVPCYEVKRAEQAFAVQLNAGSNGYRLPTEEEWEYACRAGSSTLFSFSDRDADLADYAWHDENSEFRTHEVGTKRCNRWGLFDMHGNIWEWCWRDSPQLERIARGGGWSDWPGRCRASFRLLRNSTYRTSGLGIRVVRACDD